MIQEIIALSIVAIAAGITIKNIYTFFNSASKGKICSCSSCPSNDLLKQIKKQKPIKH
jgi:hypothetical protein